MVLLRLLLMSLRWCFCASLSSLPSPSPFNIYRKVVYLVRLNNYAKYHPVGISNRFPFLHYIIYEQHDILPRYVLTILMCNDFIHLVVFFIVCLKFAWPPIDKFKRQGGKERRPSFRRRENVCDGGTTTPSNTTQHNTTQSRRPFFNNSFSFCFCKFFVNVRANYVYVLANMFV